ncbi:glutaminase [Microbacterium sp. NPDC089189]|uniref:glutaminase n=1 Tax=Microbacterium sp. NPDC089189 TaxID=3154972 RepID=UPI003425F537
MRVLDELWDAARRDLSDAPRESLAAWHRPRVLGIPRAPRLVPVGSAWHLGVLLLGEDEVWATGDVVRSREDVRRGFAAESQRSRAEVAAAAFRGGYPEGATLHLGWEPIDEAPLAAGAPSGPLRLDGDEPVVRWSAGGGWQPLRSYLAERVALLRDPPAGAS